MQDTPEKLADIRRLVQTLDVPVKQLLIEARIVIVSDTFERDLGAKLGITTATSACARTTISRCWAARAATGDREWPGYTALPRGIRAPG